ncbi:MAG: DUF4339 domain-containing protein [Akkermansia sp.]|nr:DUF4339 domain-containing protein [Akkermansia sp.]
MDIYWIENGKRKGPVTVPDIISLVQMGELTPDTQGWHAGCAAWMPLRELPALADFLGNLENRSKAAKQEDTTPAEREQNLPGGLPPIRHLPAPHKMRLMPHHPALWKYSRPPLQRGSWQGLSIPRSMPQPL